MNFYPQRLVTKKSSIWYSEFGKFKSYFGISPQPTGMNYFVIGRSVVNEKRPADGSAT